MAVKAEVLSLDPIYWASAMQFHPDSQWPYFSTSPAPGRGRLPPVTAHVY